jgi:hypothetical protein
VQQLAEKLVGHPEAKLEQHQQTCRRQDEAEILEKADRRGGQQGSEPGHKALLGGYLIPLYNGFCPVAMKKSAEAGPESIAFFAAFSARFGVLFAKAVLYNGTMKNTEVSLCPSCVKICFPF